MIKCFCYWFGNSIFPFRASNLSRDLNQQRRLLDFLLVIARSTLSYNISRSPSSQPKFMMNFIFILGLYANLDVNLYFSNYGNLLVIVVNLYFRERAQRVHAIQRDFARNLNWGTDRNINSNHITFVVSNAMQCSVSPPAANAIELRTCHASRS